jgi:phage-related protein
MEWASLCDMIMPKPGKVANGTIVKYSIGGGYRDSAEGWNQSSSVYVVKFRNRPTRIVELLTAASRRVGLG